MEIPFIICDRKIVHDCEKCGQVMVLPDEEPRTYACPKCQTEFKTEKGEKGELIIILSPIVPQ